MYPVTKEIKKRLREAGYSKNSVRSTGFWLHITITDRDQMSKRELINLLTAVFGKEYAEEIYPPPTDNWLMDPPRASDDDMHSASHLMQERVAEMLFGWREKKYYCNCGAIYELDQKETYEKCRMLH